VSTGFVSTYSSNRYVRTTKLQCDHLFHRVHRSLTTYFLVPSILVICSRSICHRPTMKFSAITVTALLALNGSASAFGGFRSSAFNGNNGFAVPSTRTTSRNVLSMSLSDLEQKLLSPVTGGKKSAPAKAAKPAPAKAPKPAPKAKAAPVPAPKAAPAPVAVKSYDLPKVEKPKPEPKKVAPPPKVEKPKPKPAPVSKAPATPSEPANPALGVALGAAPLLAVPLLALAAGRGALTKTVARREQIQKEIQEIERKRKAKIQAQTDGTTLGKAVVSIL